MLPTLLLWLLALPLATAVVVALLGSARAAAVRRLSLACTVVCFALAVAIAIAFASSERVRAGAGPEADAALMFKPELSTRWDLLPLGPVNGNPSVIQFYVGVDGLNVWLVLLTALLMVPSVLVSWTAVQERVPEFYAWLLALETGMIGVFLAFDIVLFYVFFELTLVPLFFLIGIWGGPQRQYAARKFFIYTLAGSLITLLGVLGVVLVLAQTGPERKLTFSIPELVRVVDRHSRELPEKVRDARENVNKLAGGGRDGLDVDAARDQLRSAEDERAFWQRAQLWVFVALMCGFAIKVPLVPLHTWLPLAHVEAPTAGSVLLAGVLLKIGAYGFLRLCVPLAPDASLSFGTPLIGTLGVIGILYGSFCAYAQDDIKKLVAYSSVAHLGYCMLGVFALNEVGLTGGLLQMVNHGLSTGALFLLVGMLYERYHTRKMADYGGMAARLHLLAAFFVFIAMTSIGLPGLNGFVGEALVLLGMYNFQGAEVSGRLLAALATFGVVLGAWYMLTLLLRVFFGPVKEPHHDGPMADLTGRELAALVPVALLCLGLGVFPKMFFDTVKPDLKVVTAIADRARARASGNDEFRMTNAERMTKHE
jgi:NADH-quinone oxidoreductase subunit M